MKSNFIAATVVALATLSGASAFAQTQNHQYGEAALTVPQAASGNTQQRIQVRNADANARQNGEVATSTEGAFAATTAAPSAITRQAVRAEAAAFARSHQIEGRSVS